MRPPRIIAKRKASPPSRTSVEASRLLLRVSRPKRSAIGATMPARMPPPTKSGATFLEKSGFDDEGSLLGAPEGAQGLLLPHVPEVEHEREEREGRGEAGGQEGRGHQHPVARPHRDGGRADQVPRVEPDEEAERQGEDREEALRDQVYREPRENPPPQQAVLGGLAGG